jgi:hypothetical protein
MSDLLARALLDAIAADPESVERLRALANVLETLAARAWLTGRVSAAALVRKVDAERPTLLLDESDAAHSRSG